MWLLDMALIILEVFAAKSLLEIELFNSKMIAERHGLRTYLVPSRMMDLWRMCKDQIVGASFLHMKLSSTQMLFLPMFFRMSQKTDRNKDFN